MNEICERLLALREKKRAIEAQLTQVNEEYDLVESELMNSLIDAGLDSIKATCGMRFSVVRDSVPTLDDYDALVGHIREAGEPAAPPPA